MESYSNLTPLWDLSQATNFSQLADDDFLALLQKQFPPSAQPVDYHPSVFGDGVNPQNISQYALPSLTPSSEDSSPSPQTMSNKQSPEASIADDFYQESGLKRKASADSDLSDGPSLKNAHTEEMPGASSKNNKFGGSKRKTSGSAPNKDETRLIKRKEQNRAAQRAFRERKEKHVKDLEEKVAALESKNEQAAVENENLRDLLSRLQSENMALKQSSFTFSVPKQQQQQQQQPPQQPPQQSPQQPVASTSSAKSPTFASATSNNNLFSSLPRITYSTPNPSNYTNLLDMSSMMSFDPSVLSLLDESPQETATDSAMQMDFGFGKNNTDEFLPRNYTTIATNPTFFSLTSVYDRLATPTNLSSSSSPSTSSVSRSPPTTHSSNDRNPFSFDFNSLTQWPTSPPTGQDSGTLDDLFGGSGFLNAQHNMDVTSFMSGTSPSAVSPIIHQTGTTGSPITSASSSPASHTSDPLFSGREGSSSESETGHDDSECPKTREELHKHIESTGPSAFVDPITNPAFIQNISCNPDSFSDSDKANMSFLASVDCDGRTTFPPIEKNDHNVPVLDAWRNITRDPQYKECDIANLCSEFASKARCDGSKVVLEPQGVTSLMETIKKRH